MSVCVQYPSAGCIVEYLEGNAIQIALVTEESGGKLRLLLPNRRETRLTTSRLLPWAGPALGSVPGKDESARVLEQHRARREELAAALPVLELWEMSQGEVPEASAQWFAELAGQAGDADSVAACVPPEPWRLNPWSASSTVMRTYLPRSDWSVIRTNLPGTAVKPWRRTAHRQHLHV